MPAVVQPAALHLGKSTNKNVCEHKYKSFTSEEPLDTIIVKKGKVSLWGEFSARSPLIAPLVACLRAIV